MLYESELTNNALEFSRPSDNFVIRFAPDDLHGYFVVTSSDSAFASETRMSEKYVRTETVRASNVDSLDSVDHLTLNSNVEVHRDGTIVVHEARAREPVRPFTELANTSFLTKDHLESFAFDKTTISTVIAQAEANLVSNIREGDQAILDKLESEYSNTETVFARFTETLQDYSNTVDTRSFVASTVNTARASVLSNVDENYVSKANLGSDINRILGVSGTNFVTAAVEQHFDIVSRNDIHEIVSSNIANVETSIHETLDTFYYDKTNVDALIDDAYVDIAKLVSEVEDNVEQNTLELAKISATSTDVQTSVRFLDERTNQMLNAGYATSEYVTTLVETTGGQYVKTDASNYANTKLASDITNQIAESGSTLQTLIGDQYLKSSGLGYGDSGVKTSVQSQIVASLSEYYTKTQVDDITLNSDEYAQLIQQPTQAQAPPPLTAASFARDVSADSSLTQRMYDAIETQIEGHSQWDSHVDVDGTKYASTSGVYQRVDDQITNHPKWSQYATVTGATASYTKSESDAMYVNFNAAGYDNTKQLYTTIDTQIGNHTKWDTIYTKAVSDSTFVQLNAGNYNSTKPLYTTIDTQIDNHNRWGTVYTKQESETAFAQIDGDNYPGSGLSANVRFDHYTKPEIDAKLSGLDTGSDPVISNTLTMHLIEGVGFHVVNLASSGNVRYYVNSGTTYFVFEDDAIDGVDAATLAPTDLFLLKDGGNQITVGGDLARDDTVNGVWYLTGRSVTQIDSALARVAVRAPGYNTLDEIVSSYVYVQDRVNLGQGTNAGSSWFVTQPTSVAGEALGTTGISYTPFVRTGFGSMAYQFKENVNITGGNVNVPEIHTNNWTVSDGQVITLALLGNTTDDKFQVTDHTDRELFAVDGKGVCTCREFFALSDRKLKTDITQIQNATDLVTRLEGVTFNWKQQANERGKSYGFIAQDVETGFPSLVTNHGDHKLVDYTKVVPILVEAVKELYEKVKERTQVSRGHCCDPDPVPEAPQVPVPQMPPVSINTHAVGLGGNVVYVHAATVPTDTVEIVPVAFAEGYYYLSFNEGANKVDGANVEVGHDILVKDGVPLNQNGVYSLKTVQTSRTGITWYVCTRAETFKTHAKIAGAYVYVYPSVQDGIGETNPGYGFACLSPTLAQRASFVIDTGAIRFGRFGRDDVNNLAFQSADSVTITGGEINIETLYTNEISPNTGNVVNVKLPNAQTAKMCVKTPDSSIFEVSYDGVCTGSEFFALSDRTLKTDVTKITNATGLLHQMDGVTFNWVNRDNSRGKSYGFIAQQIQENFPSLVRGDSVLTVDYGKVVAILVESVKELKEMLL